MNIYGKIENGLLYTAPGCLESYGKVYYNPSAEMYAEHGYMPVIDTAAPTDGKYYTCSWVQSDGKIVKLWSEATPPARAVTLEERVTDCEDALIELAEIITEG